MASDTEIPHYTTVQQLTPHRIDDNLYVDYCLVFSGLLSKTIDVEQLKRADQKHFQQIRSFILDTLGDVSSPLITQLRNTAGHELMTQACCMLSYKSLYLLSQLLEYGDYPEVIDKLITHTNDIRHYIRLVERSDGFAESLMSQFIKNKLHQDERIGIMPVYSGKHGGNYLIVLKRGYSKKTLLRTMESIQETYQDAAIHYSSRDDGVTTH